MAKQKMKTVDMSVNPDELDDIKLPGEEDSDPKAPAQADSETKEAEAPKASKKKLKPHVRSRKYQSARSQVDRTKTYPLTKAIELVQKTSYSKFAGSVVADLVIRDEKLSTEVVFPYPTGKAVRVAIVDDKVLAQIDQGKLDFDVLITHPSFMPKLAKYARTLGPKGLMPNPKNGTVTPEPEKRAKELAGGKTTIKSEKKSPLLHVLVGKTDQPVKELVANTDALLKAIGANKVAKLTLAATMSPGIKVDLAPSKER
jgi:large subunit ribosomal protein L1